MPFSSSSSHRSFLVLWHQSSQQPFRRDSLDRQSLTPPRRAGMKLHIRARNSTPLGDEANQFVVGGTVNRTRCQADLYRIAMNADALST